MSNTSEKTGTKPMIDIFMQALQITLSWEGGYGDHSKDPGGATNFGITRKTLSNWRGYRVTKAEVKKLQMFEAQNIYQEQYWVPACCNILPDSIAIAVFDCAVNQGVSRAKKLLQSALGVKKDGTIGPKTLQAINAADEGDLLRDFMAKRAMHYSGLKTLLTFGYGWFRRLLDVYGRALVHTKFIESRLSNIESTKEK